MAVANWSLAEAEVRRNHYLGAGPGLGAKQDELLSYFRAHSAAFDRLTYEGEAVLMFADAATNALAEAILGSWGVGKQQSLRGIAKELESGTYGTYDPDLSPYADRLWVVYLGVNLPRHVPAVHPPDGRSANAFQLAALSTWAGPCRGIPRALSGEP